MLNGIYTAYMTGVAGNSIAMLVFLNGVISGADVGGGLYDGNYEIVNDGETIRGTMIYKLPINVASIAGIAPQEKPMSIDVAIDLPSLIQPDDVYRVETSVGPINLKLVKIRSL